jgi:hypothetical protein
VLIKTHMFYFASWVCDLNVIIMFFRWSSHILDMLFFLPFNSSPSFQLYWYANLRYIRLSASQHLHRTWISLEL